MSFPTGSDREMAIYDARRELVVAVMDYVADQVKFPGTANMVKADRMDVAAAALADELRKPETCYACHQEVKK